MILVAENGSHAGSGGLFSAGSAVGQSILVQNLPLTGTTSSLSLTCPITSYGASTSQVKWSCAGGSVHVTSTDKSLAMTGSFAAGSMTLTGAGGGKGGHTTYTYQFTGAVQGWVSLAGASQGTVGSVSFVVQATAPIGSGSAPVSSLALGWNSRYSPLLVASSGNNARLLLSDAIGGANLVTYGTRGNGTGQFETIAGLAHDASNRIYIMDSTLSRLVRIDDMSGRNWLQLGSFGAGALHFSGPAGVAIDRTGKIWVADAGNNRIVRFDDMTGANWTSFGTSGSGAKQFKGPAAIAFDAQNRIYVADSGNGRLLRFDDLTGKNWTTLSTVSSGVYAYGFAGINGVAVLPSGKIVVSTSGGLLIRVDGMTGANAQIGNWAPSIASITADPGGALFVAGGFTPGLAQTLDAAGTGFFSGTLGQATIQASAVLSMAASVVPPAAPILSTPAIAFGNQNVGEPGAVHSVTLTNIGGGSMAISSVSADSDFKLANPCPASLAGGTACTIALQFDPTATGPRSTSLSVSTTSVHPLLEAALQGFGTAPHGVLLPGSLKFDPQQTTTTSTVQRALLLNTGTGPLTITHIAATGDYSVASNCPAVIAAGGGCTLSATFKPTAIGSRAGGIGIVDDNVPGGTTQTIALSGTGTAAAPALRLTPESLLFPAQQVGVASAAQTLTLKNASTAKVSLSAPVFPAGFTGTTTCGASLAGGGSCTLQVKFAPAAAGPHSASVSIPVTGQAALTAGVAGEGVTSASPILVATPSPVAFGASVVGDSLSMNMTVHNSRGYPAGIRIASLSGSGAFSVTANNCPAILAGGASCTVQFTFIPPSASSYSATWTLTESSGAKTAVPITGSATVSGN